MVSERWDRLGRKAHLLSDAAVPALEELPPGPHVGAIPVLDWAVGSPDIPVEQSSRSDTFGQPPLVMYQEADFFIQALVWIDGTTDIHQHSFDGAFAVAEGSSLHVPYAYELAEPAAGNRIVAAVLKIEDAELLRPGLVRPISAGFGFIHALFHLEKPTVTIVVRNTSSGLPHPQYMYLRSGLGFDTLGQDRLMVKRLQSLAALHRLDPAHANGELAHVVAEAEPWLALLALRGAALRTGWSAEMGELCALLAPRLGAAGPLVEPALIDEVRIRRVLARRGILSERHHRVFLALLANLPTEAGVERIVAQLSRARTLSGSFSSGCTNCRRRGTEVSQGCP
jgi:hypothetical protein